MAAASAAASSSSSSSSSSSPTISRFHPYARARPSGLSGTAAALAPALPNSESLSSLCLPPAAAAAAGYPNNPYAAAAAVSLYPSLFTPRPPLM